MSDLNNKQNYEKWVEISTQNKDSLFNKFITDFSSSYFSWEEKNNRLNSVFKSEQLTPDIKKHLELFLAAKSEEFSSWISRLDLKKINVYDFRKKTISKFLELENSRKNLKDKILNDYDIPANWLKSLDDKILILTDSEITKYLKKDSYRVSFITKLFPNVVKKQDAIKDFFLKFDILSGYTDFSQEKKDAIMKIFNNDWTLRKIDILILEELFEVGIFNLEQKKEILAYFIPSISLSEVRQLKLYWDLTDKKISEYKESIIKTFLEENKINNLELENNTEFKEWLLYLLNEDNIKIFSHDIINSSNFLTSKLDELINTYDLSDFVNSYNTKLEEATIHESKTEFKDWFDSFKNKLSELNNVAWLENLKEWNYIVLDLYLEADEKMDKDITKQFFKVKKLDNWEYWLSLIDSWLGSINLLSDETNEISYTNFISIVSKWLKVNSDKFLVSKCNFLTKTALDESIKKWLIEIYSNDDKTKTEIQDELKILKLKEDEKNINSELILEISNLDKVKKIDDEINELKLELNNPKIDIDRKNQLIILLENKVLEKEELIKELKNNNDENLPENIKELKSKLFEIENEIQVSENIYWYDKLLENLDEYDSEWKKYWLSEWVSFTSNKWIFTINKIDRNNNQIDVEWLSGLTQNISFKDFFEQFKKIKSKRLSSTKKSSDFINNICTDTSLDSSIVDSWSKFEFKDNWIYKKWSTHNIEYEYIKSSESNELIKIENISWEDAVISFWEYDEYEKWENWEIKKDKEWKKIKKSSITMYTWSRKKVSISWLESWIKLEKANASSSDEEKDVEKTNINWEKIKWNFWSRYLSRLSVFDIMSWMKLGLNSIESYLKEGTEEKWAKAAQWIFGKFLPEALRDDLMSRVEESQKKRSEDYVNKLSNVDSWKATRMIIEWLKNKDAPQYLKEAWALFMLQKYWVLYAKDLYAYKWKFLFYESFGWKIWDKLFEEVKAEAKATNQNFTEEQLLFILVKRQCWEKWYNWVRRRSRYHKEFKKMRANWKSGEYETGQWDAKDERTVWARIGWAMWELYGWTYANARWWLEEAVNKWWSMEDMNKVPFVMAFSGISYNFEQSELDQLKNFPAKSMMLPVLRFLSLSKDIDLMNQTILEVCKRYSEIKSDWSIYSEALEIFSNQKNNSLSEAKKIKKTEDFYKKHWKVLTDILYMLNTWNSWDKNKDSYISKMILIEKDDRIDDNWKTIAWNVTFKRYYNLLQAYTWEFNFWNDDLYWDAFSWKWTSWINIHKATKELLQQVQWWTYRLANAWPAMWDELRNEIDAILKRDYWIYWESWRQIDLKNMIRWFIGWLLEAHGTNSMALRSLVSSNSSTIYSKSKDWWIDLTKIMKYSYSDIMNWKAELLVNEYVDILLNWKPQLETSKFDKTIFWVKDAVNNI